MTWSEVLQRVEGLVGTQGETELNALAARLGIQDETLRGSPLRDEDQRLLRSIVVLVRMYGLDPSWLVTGQYDPGTHRIALESNTQEIAIATTRLLSRDYPPSSLGSELR